MVHMITRKKDGASGVRPLMGWWRAETQGIEDSGGAVGGWERLMGVEKRPELDVEVRWD